MTDISKEINRLHQGDFLKCLRREIRPTELVTLYLDDVTDAYNRGMYCALIPTAKIEESLGSPDWDLSPGNGLPGAIVYRDGSGERVEYHRFGNDDGIEPLIICRYFHGIREKYKEVSEEFRLFHDLYHDRKTDQYIKIHDDGTEDLVAIVEPNKIQIRLLEVRQFLAIKEMHLAIYFDAREHSKATLKELGLEERVSDQKDGLLRYCLAYGDFMGFPNLRAFSRLHGKLLIPPLPKEKSGLWGFASEEPKPEVGFIIAVDDDGSELTNKADPAKLASRFSLSGGVPDYLTPVHFRKEVLDKYYSQPSKYTVEDGYLRCSGLWGMQMDNHHDDRVIAWLGDLLRDLPHREQLHWRSHNILPSGGMSRTFFERQLGAKFSDSVHPEHVFKNQYKELKRLSRESLGWEILLPLAMEDKHSFDALRIPSNDEQKDFDDLVLALAKILIDSLNEKQLNSFIPTAERGNVKGSISRLEKSLVTLGVNGYEGHIKFLRNLQNLRSAGAAHRKGSNYEKIAEEFGVASSSLKVVFRDILLHGYAYLVFLSQLVQDGSLKAPPDSGEAGGAP